jgi:Mg-chelatase subunit ChlI
LRPQLLDRFGLSVEVASPKDMDSRVEVIRRRDAYESDMPLHAALAGRGCGDPRSAS